MSPRHGSSRRLKVSPGRRRRASIRGGHDPRPRLRLSPARPRRFGQSPRRLLGRDRYDSRSRHVRRRARPCPEAVTGWCGRTPSAETTFWRWSARPADGVALGALLAAGLSLPSLARELRSGGPSAAWRSERPCLAVGGSPGSSRSRSSSRSRPRASPMCGACDDRRDRNRAQRFSRLGPGSASRNPHRGSGRVAGLRGVPHPDVFRARRAIDLAIRRRFCADGFGGILAVGCTIGAGLTGGSVLATSSMIALMSMIAGAAATQAAMKSLQRQKEANRSM